MFKSMLLHLEFDTHTDFYKGQTADHIISSQFQAITFPSIVWSWPMVNGQELWQNFRDHWPRALPSPPGECQLGVNGQFLGKTGTKSLNFCLKSAKKVLDFGYVELKKQKKGKLLIIHLKNSNKLRNFLYWIVIQWRLLTHWYSWYIRGAISRVPTMVKTLNICSKKFGSVVNSMSCPRRVL